MTETQKETGFDINFEEYHNMHFASSQGTIEQKKWCFSYVGGRKKFKQSCKIM